MAAVADSSKQVTVPGAEQLRKARVANAGKRAAETLKRRREERWSDYRARRSQEVSEESA